jgi:hypothetical protein
MCRDWRYKRESQIHSLLCSIQRRSVQGIFFTCQAHCDLHIVPMNVSRIPHAVRVLGEEGHNSKSLQQDTASSYFHTVFRAGLFETYECFQGKVLAGAPCPLATSFPWPHLTSFLIMISYKGRRLRSTIASQFSGTCCEGTHCYTCCYTRHADKRVDWPWPQRWYMLCPHWTLQIPGTHYKNRLHLNW